MEGEFDRLAEALKGRYLLQRELGRGGMATVYLATDLKHHRPVALKVVKSEIAAALIGSERFLREIELCARLTHPHILPLHDSGNAGGLLYYVMPYVEGESLRDLLNREKQLPVDDALRISREVADALSYAHKHGVIHRDIKPENILLESGHAVVSDFGIARAIDEAGGDTLTATGIALGTPAYMSPEQAAGSKGLDGRSDLYSLGCVLYEMLAGQPPFTGPTPESVLHQHRAMEPHPITSLRPAVPAEAAAALGRALAKTPADRFDHVAAFAEALGPPISTASLAPAAPAQRRFSRRQGVLLGVAGVSLVAAMLLVGRFVRAGTHAPRNPRTSIAVLPFENLSSDGPYGYFAGGLQDEIITQLSKVASLKPISRTSVMAYAGSDLPSLRQIARELAVGSVVEASVQVVDQRLRVNVQLIDAATDQHLWAERYDRTLEDAFAVQSDVARQIVAAVGAALTGAEAAAIAAMPTENTEAYQLFLQGGQYLSRTGVRRDDLENAQKLYQRAVDLDSTFALAYAYLSVVHGYLYWYRYDPSPGRVARQRAAAEAALRLAPTLPHARWAMGMVHYWGERDFVRALPELQAAAEALPGSAGLWASVGYASRRLGYWDQTLAAYRRVTTLNPRASDLFTDLGGRTLQGLRRYGEAITAFNRALELAPDNAVADLWRAWTYVLWQGRLDSLRALLKRGPPEYAQVRSALMWRARLALLDRAPDSLLAALKGADTVTFQAQLSYEPSQLYVAWAQQVRGDRSAARLAFAAALTQLDSALRELPDDSRLHQGRGLALAGLGREADARHEAQWLRNSIDFRDLWGGRPSIMETRAMMFAQLGLAQEAVAELELLLAGNSWTSAPLIRLDPRYDPIRKDPRFQALLVKYADPQPVR